ncbi:hypothetical protein ACIQXD_29470 [Streptomyces uncialis]|uniref:hypothetical protein n=1 Tax=Streptomyces uncialis TaxID=1048205 RepID=UPI00381EC144
MTIQRLAAAFNKSDIQGAEGPAPVAVIGDNTLYISLPDTHLRIKVALTRTGLGDSRVDMSLISAAIGLVDTVTCTYGVLNVSSVVAEASAYASIWRV